MMASRYGPGVPGVEGSYTVQVPAGKSGGALGWLLEKLGIKQRKQQYQELVAVPADNDMRTWEQRLLDRHNEYMRQNPLEQYRESHRQALEQKQMIERFRSEMTGP